MQVAGAGEVYDAELTVDGHSLRLADEYRGVIETGAKPRPWKAAGWDFAAEGAWAAFEAEGGRLAASHVRPDPLSPGDYLLVAGDALAPRDGWIEHAPLYRPDGEALNSWGTPLTPADDDLLPGMRVAGTAEPTLRVDGAADWSRWSEYDAVFFDSGEGRVSVVGWTPRQAKRYLVVIEIAGQRKVLSPTGVGEVVVFRAASLDGATSGSVRLEPVGHHRGRAAGAVVTFATCPRTRVESADAGRLFAVGEPASGWVAAPPQVRVEPGEGTTVRREDDGVTRFETAGASRQLRAALVFGGQSLRLRVPVARADVAWADAPDEPVRLLRQTLAEDAARSLVIRGLPGRRVGLALLSPRREAQEIAAPDSASKSGRRTARLADLRDALAGSGTVAGRVAVIVDGQPAVATAAWYLDLDRLTPEVAAGMLDTPELPDDLRVVAQAIGGTTPAAELIGGLRPTALRSYVAVRVATSEAVAGKAAAVDKLAMWLDDALARTLGEVALLMSTLPTPTTAAAWIGRWDGISPVRTLDTRQILTAAGRAKLKAAEVLGRAAADKYGQVGRLLAGKVDDDVPHGVSVGFGYYLSCELATPAIPEGAAAFNAATIVEQVTQEVDVDVNRLKKAADTLNAQIELDADWQAVSGYLIALTALRRLDVRQFLKRVSVDAQGPAAGLRRDLKRVAALLRLQPRPTDDADGVPGLSCCARKDDRLLGKALEGDDGMAWRSAAEACWLAAWLNWRRAFLANDAAESAAMRLQLRQFVEEGRVPDGRYYDYLVAELAGGEPSACEDRQATI